MFKKSFLAAILVAGTAAADGPGPVAVAAPMIAPSVTDWSGAYVGGVVASSSVTVDYYVGGAFANGPWEGDATQYGVVAGYNFQSGSLVYGAEIAYLTGDVRSSIGTGYTGVLDLKGRVGYALGDALLFGSLGYSMGQWNDPTGGPPEDITTSGISYGVGVDYMVTNNIFVGAEYLIRDLEGDFVIYAPFSIVAPLESIELRVGYRF